MRVCKVKADERLKQKDNIRYDIKQYGEFNDYPQRLLYLTAASHSVQNCLGIFNSFVTGEGIEGFNEMQVDDIKGIKLLTEAVAEKGIFNAFAFCVGYNELGQVVSVQNIPFEYLRLQIDEDYNLTGKFLYYDDWDNKKRSKIDDDDIITFNPFNPSNVLSEITEAKGIQLYPGQIYYSTGHTYPLAMYDSVASDIATEDHIATVKYRNSANNFFPAGMVVLRKGLSENDSETNSDETTKQLLKFQGADNLGKLFVVETQNAEEEPKFIEFPTRNFDKEFEYTEQSIKQNIGSVFNQPPVLRGELIAGKLGTSSEIQDAYIYYNSITRKHRVEIENSLKEIFAFWFEPLTIDWKIKELSYGTTNQ